MTKKRKVLILNELGEDIKYHFVQYARQRRIVIDAIYIDVQYRLFQHSTEQQNIASQILEDLLNKYTGGGNYGN
ncbi:hypothetical protein [Megamonas funiformis]|uniref:hypothetical protein n=1 Tax=Megamonas funiformis TaxID=437897 RepID=UPI003F81A551